MPVASLGVEALFPDAAVPGHRLPTDTMQHRPEMSLMSATLTSGTRQSDRRRDRRISAPMTVVIGNAPYAIGDWSLGGVRVLEYSGALEPGDSTPMRVFVPTAGPGALFRADGEVRRKGDEDGSVSLAFNGLDSVAFDTLNRYFRERLLRGTV